MKSRVVPVVRSESPGSLTRTKNALEASWTGRAEVCDDAFSIVNDPAIDVVVELIGGYGLAKSLVIAAIEQGKHVVTANKALLAIHGDEIFAAAEKHAVIVASEAAVAGGIPITKALREGLTANRIGMDRRHYQRHDQLYSVGDAKRLCHLPKH
jgi:homoserine dehydrogenase